MPIEIKEVIIRTSVEKEPHSTDRSEMQLIELENIKKEVLKSCEQMINKAMKNQTRR
jgi:hypothetical protein